MLNREAFINEALKRFNTKTDIKNFLKTVEKTFIPENILEYSTKLQVIVKENGLNILYDYSRDRKQLVKILPLYWSDKLNQYVSIPE